MNWIARFSCLAFVTLLSSLATCAAQDGNPQSLESILTAASEAQANHDFSAAAKYYQQAVNISPHTAELWANLGLMEDLAGNSSEAIKSFTQAAHLNGSMYVPQLFLGIEYLKLNRPETAIPFLQKAEQINSNDPQVPLALGRAFALAGKGDRSSDAYERAIRLAPNDGNAWIGLGMARMQQSSADDRTMTETYKDSVYTRLRAGETFAEQGKLNRASDAYTSALKANPASPACTHAGYGIVLMRQQEDSKAGSEFDQELKLNPGCSLAKLGLAALRLKQEDSDGALKDLTTLWRADRGFLQENLALFHEVLSEDQRDQLLRMAKNLESAAESGDVLQSDKSASRTITGPAPQVPKEAQAFYLTGQYQKCNQNLQPRLSALPEPSLLLLAQCAFYTGDYKMASSAARRLKSIPATRVNGLYWESKADLKLAITALARAGETASNSPQLHVLLGDIYRQKQQWEDADSEYRKALALEPHNESASLGLALALFGVGKSDEALAIDKALLLESPDHPEANLLAGEISLRGGHFADAETYLKRVTDTGQKFMPHVHTLLGQVYFATDRYPQALSEFKLSQFIDEDGSIHYQLGRIYQKLGDKEKAEEAFRISKQLREHSDDSSTFPPQ